MVRSVVQTYGKQWVCAKNRTYCWSQIRDGFFRSEMPMDWGNKGAALRAFL
jgi:hypothetical protein